MFWLHPITNLNDNNEKKKTNFSIKTVDTTNSPVKAFQVKASTDERTAGGAL